MVTYRTEYVYTVKSFVLPNENMDHVNELCNEQDSIGNFQKFNPGTNTRQGKRKNNTLNHKKLSYKVTEANWQLKNREK